MEILSHENFGNVTAPYQKTLLKQYLDNGQIDQAKAYMIKYFACSGKRIFFYDYLRKDTEVYSFAEFKETRCPKEFKCPVIEAGKVESFVIQSWFLNQFGRECCSTMQVNKPLAYTDNGVHYVNLFKGFMHTSRPQQTTEFQRTGLSKIWKHINDVWASENETVFKYLKNWISHMVAGRKMKTCLYLKSGQGTGKSIITEFIQSMVLGQHIVQVTKNTKCISGHFNGELQSKVLLVLEELPVENKNEWNKLANDLKPFITNNTIEIEQKNKDPIEIPNILNIILMSNNNALRIDSDDRRTVMLDISNKYKGNHSYFDDLLTYTLDEEVGKAFYYDCIDHAKANPSFKEQIIPQTQSKKDLIVENLHTLFEFLKTNYIKKDKGIHSTFSDFYDKYKLYHETTNQRLQVENKIKVSKLLSEIGIQIKAQAQNVKYVYADAKVLKQTFYDRNWIHELDEIPEQPQPQAEQAPPPAEPKKIKVKTKQPKTNDVAPTDRITKCEPTDEEMDDALTLIF